MKVKEKVKVEVKEKVKVKEVNRKMQGVKCKKPLVITTLWYLSLKLSDLVIKNYHNLSL